MRRLTAIIVFILMASSIHAAVIHVPADQPTIQAGINAAASADTVLVSPGDYSENITIGRNILLKSLDVEETTLTPDQSDQPTIRVSGGLDSTCGIMGFTIQGSEFCAVMIEGSRPTIMENTFRDNHVIGLKIEGLQTATGAIIVNNRFFGNHAQYSNGGSCVKMDAGNTIIERNVIAKDDGSWPIVIVEGIASITNNTMDSCKMGAICILGGGDVDIRNNIISNSGPFENYPIIYVAGSAVIDFNDFWNNINGVSPGPNGISADPMYVNPNLRDYSLQTLSPCIDAGDPDPQYNDPDGSRNDMGAFPYPPSNHRPNITPIQDSQSIEGDTVSFAVVASDPESTIPILSAENLPSGATFTDDLDGTGSFSWIIAAKQLGAHVISFIASDGELADTENVTIQVSSRPPAVKSLAIDNQEVPGHVVDHDPIIAWDYWDFGGDDPQGQFEIAVGTDNEWTYSEKWNPAPFGSSDTSVTYAGSALTNGITYFLRMRVHNGILWSGWYEVPFHMNSVPSLPVQQTPVDSAIVESGQPLLYLQNSTDPETDPLVYDLEVYDDTLSGTPFAAGEDVAEQPDSTGWQVAIPLIENAQYFWRARSSDSYEYSDWTGFKSFWVNTVEEFPAAFGLSYPPDTDWAQVYDFPARFWWGGSSDPDPFDSVYFNLYVATDPDFVFMATYDSIYATLFYAPLNYSTHYWWKVAAIDTKGNATPSTNTADFMTWVLGDVNHDRATNVGDVVFLINLIFHDGYLPVPFKIGDVNGDCCVNIGDAVYLLNHIFRDGPPPLVGCDGCE